MVSVKSSQNAWGIFGLKWKTTFFMFGYFWKNLGNFLIQHLVPLHADHQCDQIWRNFATRTNIQYLWQIFEGLCNVWQNFEPTLANYYTIWCIVTRHLVTQQTTTTRTSSFNGACHFGKMALTVNNKVTYTKVEPVGANYSCSYEFIQWRHAGLAGFFIHLCHWEASAALS